MKMVECDVMDLCEEWKKDLGCTGFLTEEETCVRQFGLRLMEMSRGRLFGKTFKLPKGKSPAAVWTSPSIVETAKPVRVIRARRKKC